MQGNHKPALLSQRALAGIGGHWRAYAAVCLMLSAGSYDQCGSYGRGSVLSPVA